MIAIIIEQTALYIPLLIGAYCSISLMKIPNLSLESAFVFGALCATKAFTLSGNQNSVITLLLALLLSACGGFFVGLCMAFFQRVGRLTPLLASIVTIGLFHGISQCVLGTSHWSFNSDANPLTLFNIVEGYPELALLATIALTILITACIFFKTQLGICCALYGNNKRALERRGVSSSYVIAIGLGISDALAGISGYLIAQSNGFVDLSMGVGIPLLCITAIIMGTIVRNKSNPIAISIPLIGIFFYFILQQCLLKLGFDLRYFTAIQAIAVFTIICVCHYFSTKSSPLTGI